MDDIGNELTLLLDGKYEVGFKKESVVNISFIHLEIY